MFHGHWDCFEKLSLGGRPNTKPSFGGRSMMFLGLFMSAIQALIFATLVVAYIGESMEGYH